MQRRLVAEMTKCFAHLRKEELGLIAEAEQGLRTAEFLSGASYLQHLIGCHRMGAGIARIAAEGAIPAVVAAKIRQRDEYLARVGYDAGLEALFCSTGGRQQARQTAVWTADQLKRTLPRDRHAGAQIGRTVLPSG